MSNKPQFVRLSAQAATAELRTEVYRGEEHIIVPVVAIVGDIVTQGLLSTAPEFIPADVLAAAPSGWNGRPILAAHPIDGPNGANEPSTWSTLVFGQVFHSEFSDNRLRVEAWLSRSQAERAGEDAVEVVDKVQAGEMVEVSIGAWVWMEDAAGVAPDGSTYKQIWRACVPDHLAMGLQTQGGVGACNNRMGCGGPRVFSAKQATEIKETHMPHSMLTRLAMLAHEVADEDVQLTLKNAFPDTYAKIQQLAEGMSDNELRRKLNKALRAIVPGFYWVEEVFPESSTAIYSAAPEDTFEFWECSYSVDGDKVSIGRRKRVEPVTEWKKVAASAGEGDSENKEDGEHKPAANAGCKCHETAAKSADGQAAREGKQGDGMSDKVKELVGRLTANAATKLTDADVDKLSALSEEQLTALVELVEKPAVETVKEVQVPAQADPNLVTLSKDQVAELTRLANRERDREKAHRASLVKSLVDSGVCKYTETQLAKKDTDDLQLLAESLGVFDVSADGQIVDYTGRGQFAVHAANASEGADDYAPPDPYGLPAATAAALGYRATKNVQ